MKKQFRSWRECVSLRELQSLKVLSHHAQIVALHEVIRESDFHVYFVFEYMPDGNLYEFIKKNTPHRSLTDSNSPPPVNLLTEAKIQSITKQVFQGLAYLHAKGFVHRDIKPENLLLRGDTCKVADFGLAREVSSPYPCTEYVSTRWYRAGEVLLRSPQYGKPVDMFAVGCIMAELYSRVPLFPGKDEIDQLDKMVSVLGNPTMETWPEGVMLAERIGIEFPSIIEQATRPASGERRVQLVSLERKVPTAPPRAIQLIKDLIQWNPEGRPSANQAIHDPYYSKPYATPKHSTLSAEKNRALNLVTASPGDLYSTDAARKKHSPPPLVIERRNRADYGDSTNLYLV